MDKVNITCWVCGKPAILNTNECKGCQEWLASKDPFIADIADELAEERIADAIDEVEGLNFCV